MRISLSLTLLVALAGCGGRSGRGITGGNPERGQAAVFHYGCGACHTIARIANARGRVGPPLTGIGERMYVAGMLPNTPDNLEHWIRNPKSVNEKTAMPNLGVTPEDASDIAAFLYAQ